MTATATAPAPGVTDRQLAFIRTLAAEKQLDDATRIVVNSILEGRTVTTRTASTLISVLMGLPRVVCTNPDRLVETGMYLLDGVVYKVQKSRGTNNLYAKVLTLDLDGGASFEYSAGAASKLRASHKMSLAQATEWGVQHGICCSCGANLTDPTSIARGIGPVCATRF